MYKKWYFELVVIQFESATHLPPMLRVGLANTNGFVPYPGSGEQWGSNAVGDDLYSYAFDGVNLWTGQFNYTNRVRFFLVTSLLSFSLNRISGVMVSMINSCAVDHGLGQVKTKTIKLLFAASPLSM